MQFDLDNEDVLNIIAALQARWQYYRSNGSPSLAQEYKRTRDKVHHQYRDMRKKD